MANFESTSNDNHETLCIQHGAAVSAKFRGAFCEAIVNKVDREIYCRVQLDAKKSVKVKVEDVTGNITVNNKVKVAYGGIISSGVVLKIIDDSRYHVVFNDGDTGILRRNQLVLKGDRHYKLSECLDRQPLTNPEQFTKAVINEKRVKDKYDTSAADDEFDETKSCSQESMTTVSSSKTRSRQQTVASSASVGTVSSSVTAKTTEDAQTVTIRKIKAKKHMTSKYSVGSLAIVNKAIVKLKAIDSDKCDKKIKPFVGLIVPSSLFVSSYPLIKATQCAVKSFRDNYCYVAYKRDLEVILKRDVLIKHKESDQPACAYFEKCILFFDLKILPDDWDVTKLLSSSSNDNVADTEQTPSKEVKCKLQSPRTSISSLDSLSNDDGVDGHSDNGSEHSNADDQNEKDEWVARFYGFWEDKGSPINIALEIMEMEVDIYRLYELVKDFGGFQKITSSVRWPLFYHMMKLPHGSTDNYLKLQTLYKKFIFPYVDMKRKLGTFEQIRNRRVNDRSAVSAQKARPILSARERREYQSNVMKKTEACSVSSQSVCERNTEEDKMLVSGDELVTVSSALGDLCHLSQCSSASPKNSVINKPMDAEHGDDAEEKEETKSNVLSPGTSVSVPYGDDLAYKAIQIDEHKFIDDKMVKSPVSSCFSSSSLKQPKLISSLDCGAVDKDLEDGNALYKVHTVGWDSRHNEVMEVHSDNEQQQQHELQEQQMANINIDDTFTAQMNDDNDILADISDVSADIDFSDSDQIDCVDSKHEPINIQQYENPVKEDIQQITENVHDTKPIIEHSQDTLSRRRCRSESILELPHITAHQSRVIASLNLSKLGDTMPMRPSINYSTYKNEIITPITPFKDDSDNTLPDSPCGSKRHSNITDDIVICSKLLKIEEEIKTKRSKSPSFSNGSTSDTSTIPFTDIDGESFFFLDNDDTHYTRKIEQKPTIKVGKTRGRKPLYKVDKKLPISVKKIKEQKQDIADAESTSSQHSGSAHDKRTTRSLKLALDQNNTDDNSMHLEEDSQTSQDGVGFPLPTTLPIDFRTSSMTPLATGTPTSSCKGRRPKARRKNRNSQSNSSAECSYQDSIGEMKPYHSKMSDNSPTTQLNHNNKPSSGRIFKRIHPSLIPNDLQKLPPEERVKLLESLIRQTHLNFLDTKDKIKYVEKRISEIKTSRANGHSIESDEDKFR